jgi:hypothetical protein
MTAQAQQPVEAASQGPASAGAMAAQQTLPARLGQYRLLRRIGEGGTSVVHLAASGPDSCLVAVKTLRPPAAGSAEARCRFAREVEAMCRVCSPFVTEVTDADVTGEIPYIVTRFVPGPNLAQVVAGQGPLQGRALQPLPLRHRRPRASRRPPTAAALTRRHLWLRPGRKLAISTRMRLPTSFPQSGTRPRPRRRHPVVSFQPKGGRRARARRVRR